MKIKSILHAAALRFCLIAIAMSALSQTMFGAEHKASSGNNQTLVVTQLKPITNLSISGDDVFYDNNNVTTNTIKKNTYYDNDQWFHEGSSDRSISEDTSNGNKKHVVWKNDHYFVFKVNSGLYSLKVCFRPKQNGRGMRVFSGTSKDSPNNHIDVSENAYGYLEKEFIIHVTEEYEYLWLTGTSGDVALYSVELKEIQPLSPDFPSDLNAITSDIFWYHNAGDGLYSHGTSTPFYRYIGAYSGAPYSVTSTNAVTINNTAYKSYELKTGDAIGFKLSTNTPYRIKMYYYVDPANTTDYAVADLQTGTQANNTWWVSNPTEETIIRDSTGGDTGTRLRTYDLNTGSNEIFWIKNANTDGKSMYLGGYEILPSNQSATIPDQTFSGTWYVTGDAVDLTNNNGSANCGSTAMSHGNVVLWGPTMAINNYELEGNKTVMLNNGSRIGVNIPAGSTLSFPYTADGSTKRLKLIDTSGNGINLVDFDNKENATGNYNYYKFPYGEISYTNNTGANQKVWITGESVSYAYFGAFKIPTTGPSIDNAVPISQDYVWYPVDRTYVYGSNVYTDTHQNVYVYTDFQIKKDSSTGEMIKPEKHTLRGNNDAYFYRTDKNTQLGFKIAQGKKGVINLYYIEDKESTRKVQLYKSGNPAALGSAIGDTHKVNNEGNIVIATQYHFDTTGGEETFWLKAGGAAVWFGGFEVLFEDANNGGQSLSKDTEYTFTTTATIENALGTDTHTVFKSVNTNPVGGASMMMYHPGKYDAVAVGGNTNGIIVKVPSDCQYLNIKGYLDGDASFKIYKGTASAPDKSASVTLGGSGNIDKSASLAALSSVSGDVYWITSDDVAGAYVTSVTPKDGTFTELQPTDVNYIYKVDAVPSTANGGVQNSGDTNGRIMFVDANGSAWSNTGAKMNVLGTEVTPVVIENGNDFFAVKVDQGPYGVKTGYIKVYFNGGSAAAHKMEELPLNKPLYAGWNSSYNPDTQVITFDGGGGGRGWWFGNEGETGVRDLSAYNKINIQLGTITGNPSLKLVVQSTNGAGASFEVDSQGRLIGDLTDQSKWFTSDNGATFDITKISQIYIQDNNTDATSATVEIKSARLMNKPVVIATDNDQNPANGYTELFGGKIYDLPDGKLYEYPFDLSKASSVPQLVWITGAGTTGTTNIAAIQVLYDSNHAKVVDWYVNKDTKMIVGSDDPNFKINFQNQTLEYPTGYDEYVTFYMSSGRQANVSFIMPEAVREVDEWFALVEPLGKAAQDGDFVKESKVANIANTYGKHTIHITGVGSGDKFGIASGENGDKISFQSATTMTYDRDNAISADRGKINSKGPLYSWYNYSYDLPSNIFDKDYTNKDFAAAVKVTATQKVNGSDDTEKVGGKEGQWKIYMRFISFAAPEASRSGNDVSVAGGQSGKSIYYTMDSSEPENLGDTSINSARSTTEPYNSSVNVADMNCIFKAAQYIKTDYHFYEDISKGKDSAIGNVFKVVSRDLAIENEIPSVVYVKDSDPDDGKAQIFNRQDGGYMLTIPTGDVMSGVTPHEQKYNANPLMYLTLGGKDWPYYIGGNAFNLCGTNWKASNDGGLKTYLDSYQYKMDVADAYNIAPWSTSDKQNQNPYTECNGGVGGSDTEDGGMFLQPIGGTSLRFEPEYDGVITVWLRQNGCLDNNTMENGTFNRRPVYVMDENGRIMRRSTIRPTASHYMGINGTWGINSSVCEQRSQVENTWIAELAKQIYQDHPLYASRFATMTDRWATANHDHSGHILYGWWYKGFDLNATRSTASSAAHVSRFEYMEPELLYRSDGIFNMEMNQLGLTNAFAKYGFELPNFQYVRYRIPVKAGKTYYIAGRGTKNGFAAIRFDAVAPNTNLSKSAMEDLRYSDNPEVVENQTAGNNYLKLTNNWDNNGARSYKSTDRSAYDFTGKSEAEVLAAYNKGESDGGIATVTFKDSKGNNFIKDIVNDGKTGMDYDTYGNLVGKTINCKMERTFKRGNWHPIILPFSLSETRVEQYFGEGTVVLYLDPATHTAHNQIDESTGKSWTSVLNPALEGTKLSFTIHRYQMIYANTPAFICPTFTWSDEKKSPATNNVKPTVKDDGSVESITFKRVTLDGSNSQNDLGNGYFGYAISDDYEVVGTYDPVTLTGDIYYVNNTNPAGGFTSNTAELVHSTGKSVSMRAFRVWIRPKAGRNAAPIKTVGSRGFSDFEEDSEMTGISDIVADDYTIEGYDIEDDSVYDLLGRKVGQGSLDGLQKGIYIFHGRKVYVK